jgi:peptide/nickel transport system ATP-binding protein
MILKISNLIVAFRTYTGVSYAVDDITISLSRGDTLGIVGESGSGKSTTALAIMNLLPTPAGKIEEGQIWFTLGGQEINLVQYPRRKMQSLRGDHIAMVFQDPMSSLNPVFRCGDQVMETILRHQKVSKSEAREKTINLFREVGLPRPEEIFFRYPHQLSGGQKQRVMIAMGLSCNPDILIADEPTSALDVTVQSSILSLLNDLQKNRKMSIIFISHDLGVIAEVADYVAVMYRGKIVEHAPVWDIFADPKHPYTKGLMTCRPPLKNRVKHLPTVTDFMEEKVDAAGNWTVSEKVHTSVEEMLLRSIEPLEAYERRLQQLMQHPPLLVVKGLKKYFAHTNKFLSRRETVTRAVDDVSFEVYPGETLGVVGESGSGKTTLASTILRLKEPTDGQIFFKGLDLIQLSSRRLRRLRRQVQIIFQDPYSSLNPRMTVETALSEPLRVHGILKTKRERVDKSVEILELVGLASSHLKRFPHEFSGGQRQRICIARALILEPDLLFCDEAVSALDVSIQAQVLNLLSELKRRLNLTYIFISHDLAVVKFMSDRIMVMNNGKIEEIGPAEDIYNHPRREYTRKLIAATPEGGLEDIRRQQDRRRRPAV